MQGSNNNNNNNNNSNNNKIRVKVLERITVNGYVTSLPDKVRVAYCEDDNTYYLLEDPINVKEEIELSNDRILLLKVKDKNELYNLYVSSFITNDLNPFLILLRYKQGYRMPSNILPILQRNTIIPDELLEELNRELLENLKKGKRIEISLSILDALRWCYETYLKNKDLLKMTIRDFVDDLIDENEERIIYPEEIMLVSIVDHYLEDAKKEQRRKEMEVEVEAEEEVEEEVEEEKEGKGKVITLTAIPEPVMTSKDAKYITGIEPDISNIDTNNYTDTNAYMPTEIYIDITVKHGWLNVNLTVPIDFDLTDDDKEVMKKELLSCIMRFLRR